MGLHPSAAARASPGPGRPGPPARPARRDRPVRRADLSRARTSSPTASRRLRPTRRPAVKQAIAAGNQLIGQPYVYGGGHASFISNGYDCSGTVSYALHGANLLTAPLDSSEFEQWGAAGAGDWITVYTNPQHAYVDIAGIRLDTSRAGDPGGQSGPRWRPLLASNRGFAARHFPGT